MNSVKHLLILTISSALIPEWMQCSNFTQSVWTISEQSCWNEVDTGRSFLRRLGHRRSGSQLTHWPTWRDDGACAFDAGNSGYSSTDPVSHKRLLYITELASVDDVQTAHESCFLLSLGKLLPLRFSLDFFQHSNWDHSYESHNGTSNHASVAVREYCMENLGNMSESILQTCSLQTFHNLAHRFMKNISSLL